MKIAKIDLSKGFGKQSKVREKSVKSQGILKTILSGNPAIRKAPKAKKIIPMTHAYFCHRFVYWISGENLRDIDGTQSIFRTE